MTDGWAGTWCCQAGSSAARRWRLPAPGCRRPWPRGRCRRRARSRRPSRCTGSPGAGRPRPSGATRLPGRCAGRGRGQSRPRPLCRPARRRIRPARPRTRGQARPRRAPPLAACTASSRSPAVNTHQLRCDQGLAEHRRVGGEPPADQPGARVQGVQVPIGRRTNSVRPSWLTPGRRYTRTEPCPPQPGTAPVSAVGRDPYRRHVPASRRRHHHLAGPRRRRPRRRRPRAIPACTDPGQPQSPPRPRQPGRSGDSANLAVVSAVARPAAWSMALRPTGEPVCVPSAATLTWLIVSAGPSPSSRPVEDGFLEYGLQRHLDRAGQPGDRLAVDVPGDEDPDVVPREQLEQRGLVVDVVVLAGHREMLEQQGRPACGGEVHGRAIPARPHRSGPARAAAASGRTR